VSASTLVVKEGASTLGSFTIKRGDLRVNDLTQSQKWPVGFGPSGRWLSGSRATRYGMGRMVTPLTLWVFYLPIWPWIGSWIVMRIWLHPWRFWKPLKRTSIRELRQRVQRPKVGGKF
jgi:hypothetical protein